ncbi:MAG: hypothetical protein C0489_12815, partial [Candidatus Accumulibacter sp.]|nr:hypothetical protein [Accumulibacter sp.]
DHEEPEIGLVAMIDCIFFLLMFFMLATTFKEQTSKPRKELPVQLPRAEASVLRAGAVNDALVIGVDRSGGLFVDTRAVTVQELHTILAREAAADPERRIRIEGDRDASYQHIVRVLDLCQLDGLTNIAMRTRD